MFLVSRVSNMCRDWRLAIASAVLLLGFQQPSYGATPFAPTPAYYLANRTFALEPNLGDDTAKRRIVTFLPDHTLLFNEVKPLVTFVEKEEYKTVITQHGFRVLIPAASISKSSFRTKYGRQTIIYHVDGEACPLSNIDCDDTSSIPISKGHVLELISRDENLVKLKVEYDGEANIYAVKAGKFEAMRLRGDLTDAAVPYPRYLVNGISYFDSLGTSCGDKKENVTFKSLKGEIEASAEPGDLIAALHRLSGVFKLNLSITGKAELEKSETIKSEYGSDTTALRFYKVRLSVLDRGLISENGGREEKDLYIVEELACLGQGPMATPIYVQSATVKEDVKLLGSFDFERFYPNLKNMEEYKKESSPQFQVYQKNGGRPFLVSVNSNKQYNDVVGKIIEQVEDSSLAAILVQTFNSSCPETKGVYNYRVICRNLLDGGGVN